MISIIMPTYNRAYIISRAIESVLKQTNGDWELIVIDDASQDNTEEVVNNFYCHKIRYFKNIKNKGANESRNIGMQNARGEFLAFLDSDNYWPDNKLEIQINKIRTYTCERCFVYGKVQIRDGKEVKIVPQESMTTEELKRKEMHENLVDLNTILIRKTLLLECGGFEKGLPRLQDWELVLRMLYDFDVEAIGCEECLSFNEIQENSIGRDSLAFVRAVGFLYKKYMCKYLHEDEMAKKLFELLYVKNVAEDVISKSIEEVIVERSSLLFTTLKSFRRTVHVEHILYEWHRKNLNNREGTLFSRYFYKGSRIKTIAIYGLGKLGLLFFDEVKCLPVKIAYGIDKEKKELGSLVIKRPDEYLEQVDWIVITTIKDNIQIKENLEKNCSERSWKKVITLEELIQKA